MIPQQAMMNDALSPHTPSPLPADADATVTGTDIVYLDDVQPQPVEWLWQHWLAAGTLAMLSGEPGSGKRQDAQMNCLSTLSIFVKQTTYLATLPKRSGKLLNSNATAKPGDVVLGRNGGDIFIPPQLAEQVAKSSESTHLRDVFGPSKAGREEVHRRANRRAMDGCDQAGLSFMAKQDEDHLSVRKEQIEEILQEHQ